MSDKAVVREPVLREGVLLSGRFVSITKAKGFQRKSGETVEPVKLTLLAGESHVRVEFDSVEAAQAAVGVVEMGGAVVVPVWVDGPWDSQKGRRSAVYFRGR